jgi:HEAT repeat protein
MFQWLRLWQRSRRPTKKRSEIQPKGGAESYHSPDLLPPERTVSISEAEPVLVRGDLSKNTAVAPDGTVPQPKAEQALDVSRLVQRLQYTDSTIRRSTAEELERIGPNANEAIPALLHAAVDVDATVRRAAVSALNHIDPAWWKSPRAAEAVSGLVQALGSQFAEVWQAASHLLGQIGQPAVPELIRALAPNEKDTLQVIVAWTLGRMGPDAASAVPALTTALTSQFAHVRQAAAEALCEVGQAAEPAAPTLVLALADWHPMVRRAAARSLSHVEEAAELVVPALIQLLADRDDEVREASIEALAHIGPTTVPLLIEFLQARDFRQMQAWLQWKLEALDWYSRAAEWLEHGGVVRI